MPDVVKHAWTHRPKSQGGTDPIEIPAASDLIWGLATASTTAVADGGNFYRLTFDGVYSNDATAFEPADVTAGRADWLQVNLPGYYILKAEVIRSAGVFADTGADIWLETIFEEGGGITPIFAGEGIADFVGMTPYNAATRVKSNYDGHEALYDELAFNYDPDNAVSNIDFENPLKVGLDLAYVAGPATVTMAASLWMLRVAGPGYTDLSPT